MKKPNGYGSVVDLGKGRRRRYAFRISDGVILNRHGEYIQKYKYLGYFEKSAEAYDFQARYNSGEEVREQRVRSANNIPTVEKVYEQWCDRKFNGKKIYSPQLAQSYQAAFRKLAPVHSRRISTITFNELQDIADAYTDSSRSTVTNLGIIMRELFQFAKKRKWIDDNIAEDVEFSYAEKETGIHASFSREEIDLLWANAADPGIQIILIMIYTGVRITELLIMKKADVSLEQRRMTGGIKTKAGRNRPIPIADRIYPFVTALMAYPGEYLLTRPNGRRFNRKNFLENIWLPAMELTGMEHLPHDTKYTCATLMDRAGVNENCRKIILGHARQGVTDGVYTQKDMLDLLKAVNSM